MTYEELVEKIAVLHNGGTWPEHYREEHRKHWKEVAEKCIDLVQQYEAGRDLVGFFDTLTPEQQKAALEYDFEGKTTI